MLTLKPTKLHKFLHSQTQISNFFFPVPHGQSLNKTSYTLMHSELLAFFMRALFAASIQSLADSKYIKMLASNYNNLFRNGYESSIYYIRLYWIESVHCSLWILQITSNFNDSRHAKSSANELCASKEKKNTSIRGQQMKEKTSKLLVKLLIWFMQFQFGCGLSQRALISFPISKRD